jgi:hypothetical protein
MHSLIRTCSACGHNTPAAQYECIGCGQSLSGTYPAQGDVTEISAHDYSRARRRPPAITQHLGFDWRSRVVELSADAPTDRLSAGLALQEAARMLEAEDAVIDRTLGFGVLRFRVSLLWGRSWLGSLQWGEVLATEEADTTTVRVRAKLRPTALLLAALSPALILAGLVGGAVVFTLGLVVAVAPLRVYLGLQRVFAAATAGSVSSTASKAPVRHGA